MQDYKNVHLYTWTAKNTTMMIIITFFGGVLMRIHFFLWLITKQRNTTRKRWLYIKWDLSLFSMYDDDMLKINPLMFSIKKYRNYCYERSFFRPLSNTQSHAHTQGMMSRCEYILLYSSNIFESKPKKTIKFSIFP